MVGGVNFLVVVKEGCGFLRTYQIGLKRNLFQNIAVECFSSWKVFVCILVFVR